MNFEIYNQQINKESVVDLTKRTIIKKENINKKLFLNTDTNFAGIYQKYFYQSEFQEFLKNSIEWLLQHDIKINNKIDRYAIFHYWFNEIRFSNEKSYKTIPIENYHNNTTILIGNPFYSARIIFNDNFGTLNSLLDNRIDRKNVLYEFLQVKANLKKFIYKYGFKNSLNIFYDRDNQEWFWIIKKISR